MEQPPEHVDVLVVGAGLSGIGAACRLSVAHRALSFAVLEARSASGGTWDLFRYPGVRSDSDMLTLGYPFRPWPGEPVLAEGPSILAYLRDTAREYGVDRAVRYRHRVVRAHWDSAEARWAVDVETPAGPVRMTCWFLWCCAGYYDYAGGHRPEFAGAERFTGRLVHPQTWPEDLDCAGRRVVVIGSGATAVTLVPALARTASHVTMLQRSPSYVVSVAGRDPVGAALRRLLPARAAYRATRHKNVLVAAGFYRLSRARPALVRRLIRRATVRALPEGFDVDTHFRPRYDPWDQRMCLVPDGDLFAAIRAGAVSVVTDTVAGFEPDGVRLGSGSVLPADVVVTATGLELLAFGGVELAVDGRPVAPADTMTYRSLMLGGVPNFAFTLGYVNASWTLKADLVADYVCRLLGFLAARGWRSVTPEPDPDVPAEPLVGFSSGYVRRGLHLLPSQGAREPWRARSGYLADRRWARRAPIDDGVLRFGRGSSSGDVAAGVQVPGGPRPRRAVHPQGWSARTAGVVRWRHDNVVEGRER